MRRQASSLGVRVRPGDLGPDEPAADPGRTGRGHASARDPLAGTRQPQRRLAHRQLPAHLLVDGQVIARPGAVDDVQQRPGRRRAEAADAMASRSHSRRSSSAPPASQRRQRRGHAARGSRRPHRLRHVAPKARRPHAPGSRPGAPRPARRAPASRTMARYSVDRSRASRTMSQSADQASWRRSGSSSSARRSRAKASETGSRIDLGVVVVAVVGEHERRRRQPDDRRHVGDAPRRWSPAGS